MNQLAAPCGGGLWTHSHKRQISSSTSVSGETGTSRVGGWRLKPTQEKHAWRLIEPIAAASLLTANG
jgi:hypothetical protein